MHLDDLHMTNKFIHTYHRKWCVP